MRFIFVMSICFVLLISTTTWALAPDDPALVGVWLFDEGSGSTVGDSSGNGNDGTINGDFTWDSGQFGTAIVSPGAGSIEVPDSMSLATVTDGVTVAAWFRVDADSDTGLRKPNSYLLEDQSATEPVPNGFSFRIWTTDGISPGIYGQTELVQGQWSHVAGTYDGATMELYINGQPESEKGALDDGGNDWVPAWSGTIGSTDPLQLKYGSESFTGGIDEIVIFSRALTAAEIHQLMGGWNNLGNSTAVQAQDRLATTWGNLKRR